MSDRISKKPIIIYLIIIFALIIIIVIDYRGDLKYKENYLIDRWETNNFFIEKFDKFDEFEEEKLIFTDKEDIESEFDFYSVVRVVDGDTIRVDINGTEDVIRLIGINTPEIVDPRKTVECFGQEASNKAKEILNNQKVRLESDPSQNNRDNYDRLLRYVFLENGLFFNEWMIKNGYAFEYTYVIPYQYQAEFKAAENYARESKIGLWEDGVCDYN